MRPRHALLPLTGALLLAAGTAAAQSPIRAGQAMPGRLEASDPTLDDGSRYDLWSYRGSQGQRVRVTLRSSDFDAYLAVGRMENGSFVAAETDDDAGGGTDAQVVLTLAGDGEYLIRANTLSGGETGAYTLLVEAAADGDTKEKGKQPGETGPTVVRDATAGQSLHPSAGRIRAGQTLSGELQQSDPKTFDGTAYDDFIYTGQAGERLAFTLRSGAFDAYLQLGRVVNGTFDYIGAEDGGAGGKDSLYEITLPADGEYVLRVNTLFAGLGPYTLEARRR